MSNSPKNGKPDPLGRLEQTLFRLTDVVKKYQKVVETRFDVNSTDIEILYLLDEEGDKKMKDIGSEVDVKLSNLTNIVDRLEERKLVKRVNSKTDRRSIFVHITAKGKKLLSEYNNYLRDLSSRMQSMIPNDHFPILLESLEKITSVNLP